MLVDSKKSGIHRGRLDIIADILNAAFAGARKTHIMYRCNLSFKQLKRYLSFLLKRGLLYPIFDSKDPNPELFEITDKGKEFLKAYEDLKGFMN